MYGEGNFPVDESCSGEVEPTFGVAFVGGALSIAGGPDGVVIVGCSDDSVHVSGIKFAVEENVGLAGLGELEERSLW